MMLTEFGRLSTGIAALTILAGLIMARLIIDLSRSRSWH
jgi:hypothetical protein